MATKTLITEADFLQMTFEGPEPDYVDGEVVERAMPNTQHSDAQANFVVLIRPWRHGSRLFELPELRIRTAAGKYRIVDVAVYRDRKPVDSIPTETPFIAVEIVSPEDTYRELKTKLTEYKTLGVAHAWIIDPGSRSLSVFDHGSFLEVEAFEVPEFDLRLTPAQLFED
jgi:Uma2 family endonuclease